MDKYIVDKVIGEGTYGVVYKAIEKQTKELVAIKKFRNVEDDDLAKREIQACAMLSHPYIVSFRHSFRYDGVLHLVFDFLPNSMTKLLNRHHNGIPPREAQRFTFQLCKALEHCHTNHVMHRDVKVDNILIDEVGDIRLCDFGVARVVQLTGGALTDYVATRWYRPPEQELRLSQYTYNADMWSVGCILYELITGKPLFPGSSQIDQLNRIQQLLGPLPRCLQSHLPRGLDTAPSITSVGHPIEVLLESYKLPEHTSDFILFVLQLDANERPDARKCLEHPFLKALSRKEEVLRQQRLASNKGRDGDTDSIEEEIPDGCSPQRMSVADTKVHRAKESKMKKDNNDDDEDSDDSQIEEEIIGNVSDIGSPSRYTSSDAKEVRGRRSSVKSCQDAYDDDFEDYCYNDEMQE